MTKAQLLKQLDIPDSASEFELIVELNEKLNTQDFLIYEDFNVIQIIPGEAVKGKATNIIL